MSKKPRRTPMMAEPPPRTTEVTITATKLPDDTSKLNPNPTSASLAEIRDRALHAQVNTAHTIAELEAWRAEIDSTIAFLKAQRF